MSWLIEKRKTKYAVWSTIADDWITDFDTREKTVEVMIKIKRQRFNEEMKELRKTFPKGYWSKDMKQFRESSP